MKDMLGNSILTAMSGIAEGVDRRMELLIREISRDNRIKSVKDIL